MGAGRELLGNRSQTDPILRARWSPNPFHPPTRTSAHTLHPLIAGRIIVLLRKVTRFFDLWQKNLPKIYPMEKDLTCWRELNNISGSRADIKRRIRVRFYRKKGQKAGVVCSAVLLYEPLLHLPPHLKANKVFTTRCDTPPFQATMAIECTLSNNCHTEPFRSILLQNGDQSCSNDLFSEIFVYHLNLSKYCTIEFELRS